MPLLLRTVRESRWHKAPAKPWLDQDDVPADPLADLATSEQALSVWRVLPDRSNIERIVRAVILGRDKIADAGYILFDSDLLTDLQIETDESVVGRSPDREANAWHGDLVNLSGNKLVGLTKALLRHGETGVVLKKRLVALVETGIANSEIPERMRTKLP
jgi:hypothetical protein